MGKRPCNGDDRPLQSVHIAMGDTFNYEIVVGQGGVTAIKWGSMNGHMAPMPTVEVWTGDTLQSEHPFHNCLGVVYMPATEDTP